MSASRAFCRASWFSCPFDDERSETLERLKSPIAMTINRIINERVTTRAKPRDVLPVWTMRGFFGTKWVFVDRFVDARKWFSGTEGGFT
jgi:hypothetical protein